MKKLLLSLCCLLMLSACGVEPISFKVIEVDTGDVGCGDSLVEFEKTIILPGADTKWMNALKHISELDPGDEYINPLKGTIDFDEITQFRTSADLSAAVNYNGVCDEARVKAMLDDLSKQLNFKFSFGL